jgi:hypothetical protein
MTYQRDPERVIDPATEDIVRRENIARRDEEIARRNTEATNGSGFLPILLTVMILLVGGYFVYSIMYPRTGVDAPRTTENTAPRTVTPTPVPAPTAPQTK